MTRKDWLWISLAALGLAVSLGAACRYAFRPRPVPAVPVVVASPTPEAATANPAYEISTVGSEPIPEPDDAPMPCDGLGDAAALACVLADPLDLDAYSPSTLGRAERAALRERLAGRGDPRRPTLAILPKQQASLPDMRSSWDPAGGRRCRPTPQPVTSSRKSLNPEVSA